MSAAAARRRKQLLARKKAQEEAASDLDPVSAKLQKLLQDEDLKEEAIAYEAADLLYHTLVALAHHDVDLRDVYRQLDSRKN